MPREGARQAIAEGATEVVCGEYDKRNLSDAFANPINQIVEATYYQRLFIITIESIDYIGRFTLTIDAEEGSGLVEVVTTSDVIALSYGTLQSVRAHP